MPPPPPVGQTFVPPTHPVDVTVTVGSDGLGLILAEDKEGSRWGVKGFRAMPEGVENPAKASMWPGMGGERVVDRVFEMDYR